MAWTLDEFVTVVVGGFVGEVVAEYGDIENGTPNAEQRQVTLYSTQAASPKVTFRAVEAWDYAQSWADHSGRPVRLTLTGEIQEGNESANGNWGVKTFQPRISGGDEKEVPLPVKSALSDKLASGFASSANEFGTWYVPYDSTPGEGYNAERGDDYESFPGIEHEAAWSRVGINLRVGDSLLPTEVGKRRPGKTPEGCALVVFERSDHGAGYPYEWRFAAVPVGGVIRRPYHEDVVVQGPMMIGFLDCNGDYAYQLPEGSFRYAKDGMWKPTRKVVYHY